jgi:glycosyltransferase involved in cell wall biosynthesis
MHSFFSIILITKNEAHPLGRTLAAVKGLSDDVIVLDNGSTDDTIKVALLAGARVVDCDWLGYGDTKNIGHKEAKYDWILSLDADEVVDEKLYESLKNFKPQSNFELFLLRRVMIWNAQKLRFGGSIEYKIRLFHKQFASWNNSEVHEALIFDNQQAIKKKLAGSLLHFSYLSLQDAKQRNDKYAKADAIKKKNAGILYRFWLPIWRGKLEFFKVFIIFGGFLDGKNGYEFASIKQYYKQKKYQELKSMYK